MLPRQTKRTETGLGEVESLIVTIVRLRMVCEILGSDFWRCQGVGRGSVKHLGTFRCAKNR